MQPTEKLEAAKTIRRELVINGLRIHITSVFTGQTSLDDALKKIVIRKVTDGRD